MLKFLRALKLGLQVIKCLRCAHVAECPYAVVRSVVSFQGKEYVLTVKEVKEDET